MKRRYLLCPGPVRSRFDGQVHWIGPSRLARLYGVPLAECAVLGCQSARWCDDHLPMLCPRPDGDYSLMPALKQRLEALGDHLDDFEARWPHLSAAALWKRRDDEIYAASARDEDRERRLQHWKAAWMLLTTRQDDLGAFHMSWERMVLVKALCLLAMVLGRGDRDGRGGRNLRHALQCGFWDLVDDRSGWGGDSWWQLEFSWREFRYSLERQFGEGSL